MSLNLNTLVDLALASGEKKGGGSFPLFGAMLLKLNLQKMSISCLSTMLMKTNRL